MMANGALVRVLIHTDVTKYLNFKAVDGSFVYNKGKVHDSETFLAIDHMLNMPYDQNIVACLVMKFGDLCCL